jgi:DNA-binding response OmpR family regulator
VRILILEDDPLIALDLERIVEDQGFEVAAICHSLAEAHDHVNDRLDFALLDIDVTDGKSFGLAIALLERDVPFAFVSASRPAELPAMLRSARFVSKPFEERTIVRAVTADRRVA